MMDTPIELLQIRGLGLIQSPVGGAEHSRVIAALEAPELDHSVALDVPWNVVVHNDPVNLMSYVTKVFQKVFGFSKERAEKHMMEVHKQGRSIVWTGTQEKAEFYVQELHSHLLLATLEKSV